MVVEIIIESPNGREVESWSSDEPNRVYDLSAVLRIWGHCSGLQEAEDEDQQATSWNISLESHDYVDLTRTGTMDASLFYFEHLAPYFDNDTRQCVVTRRTAVRLDRLSDWDDWKPYVQVVEYFDTSKEEWTLILVCLFDRSPFPGTFARGSNVLQNYRPLIPNNVLAEAVGGYRGREHGEEPELVGTAPVSNVAQDEGERWQQRERQAASPKQPLARRRPRQRAKSDISSRHVNAGIASDMTLQSQLIYILPDAWNHVPHFLIGGVSDDYHDAIVLGLSARGRNSLIGCIAISRKVAVSQASRPSIGIKTVKASDMSNPVAGDGVPEYWMKFPRNYSPEPDLCLRPNWNRRDATSVQLSQWYSYYRNPPLIYPDSMDGPLADVRRLFVDTS